MSRRAALLTTQDVPKYVREIVSRMYPLSGKEVYNCYMRQDEKRNAQIVNGLIDGEIPYPIIADPGYMFKIYGRRKLGAEIGSEKDVKALIKWAKSWYALADIVEEHWWWNDVPKPSQYCSTKSHRNKAYRDGFRNYWIVRISDPVCNRFEKDEFYRNNKYNIKGGE